MAMAETRRANGVGRTGTPRSAGLKRRGGTGQVRRGKPIDAVGRIESGLKVAVVDQLARHLQVPAAAVRKLAKISGSTFNRRQKAGILSPEESDRIFRLRLIVDKTTAFFEGDKAAARHWLNRPAVALDGLCPIELLVNEAGVREVEALLGRLEYGVFT